MGLPRPARGIVRLAAAGVEAPSTIACLFVRATRMVCTHFGRTLRAGALPAITKLVRSISIADRSARSHSAVMPHWYAVPIGESHTMSWRWRLPRSVDTRASVALSGRGRAGGLEVEVPGVANVAAGPRCPDRISATRAGPNSAGHRWSRFGRSASRRSSASRQASSARRSIAFIARTSILAPSGDREER